MAAVAAMSMSVAVGSVAPVRSARVAVKAMAAPKARLGAARPALPLRARRSANLVARRSLTVRAAAEDTQKTSEEIVADLTAKWEALDNKPALAIYAGASFVTLWLSSTVVGAINAVPLLPKVFELVGLGYSGWFVYRYLLFKSSREELVTDIEELKTKVVGYEKAVEDGVKENVQAVKDKIGA